MDKRLLIIGVLFILLVVLCYSLITRELFTLNSNEVDVMGKDVVQSYEYEKRAPLGNDGTTHYQNFGGMMMNNGLTAQ